MSPPFIISICTKQNDVLYQAYSSILDEMLLSTFYKDVFRVKTVLMPLGCSVNTLNSFTQIIVTAGLYCNPACSESW